MSTPETQRDDLDGIQILSAEEFAAWLTADEDDDAQGDDEDKETTP